MTKVIKYDKQSYVITSNYFLQFTLSLVFLLFCTSLHATDKNTGDIDKGKQALIYVSSGTIIYGSSSVTNARIVNFEVASPAIKENKPQQKNHAIQKQLVPEKNKRKRNTEKLDQNIKQRKNVSFYFSSTSSESYS